jgi:hypothetical protein
MSPAVSLIDLTLPQLAEAYRGLDRLEHEYENMSGICATLKGLVLIEAKAKPENKQRFMAWVKENFASGGHRTATRYMRLAEAFSEGLDSTVQFQTLTRDLASSVEALKKFQLDLSHPMVAKIAQWAAGRGSYQLMLDFPGSRGGDTSAHRKKLTPEQEHAQFLENCKTDFEAALMALDALVCQKTWQAPSIPRSHLEEAADLFRQFARDISAFLK